MRTLVQRLGAVALVAAGLAWSPPAFDAWIGGGELEEPTLRAALWGLASALAMVGLWQLRAAPSRWWLRVDLVLLPLVVGLPMVGELLLRHGIAHDRWQLRTASLYADSQADTDFWLLRKRWSRRQRFNLRAIDPELGWHIPSTPENPFGLTTGAPRAVDPDAPALLFFGDSFVAGPNAPEDMLPQQLERELGGPPVLNFGVGGYGLDQIVLRVERVLPRFPRATLVVGVMSYDLDRAVLAYRDLQKPYATIEGGRLAIRGQPVEPDPEAWLARHPPAIRSYFAARLVQWNRQRAWGTIATSGYRRALKTAVTRGLLERLAAFARERDVRLLVVLFDPIESVERPRWRELLLREEVERHALPWVDAGAALAAAARARGVSVDTLFLPDQHPTPEGNAAIARAVAAKLLELGWTR